MCCARRNRRKLHERGEPYKPNRISKGEDNVPRQATSETQRNKSKNCIWGMMSGPKLMEEKARHLWGVWGVCVCVCECVGGGGKWN